MKKSTIRLALTALAAASLQVCIACAGTEAAQGAESSRQERIVSLSPSTTEILFALGLSDHVVGVTRYCRYPSAAQLKTDVGGHLDPNYEAIAALRPTVVIALPEQDRVAGYLRVLDIRCMTVDNKTTADIIGAIRAIGDEFGAESKADSIISCIEKKMRGIAAATGGMERPRTLIAIGRGYGEGSLGKVFVAGRNTFYDEILEMAGGENVCGEGMIEYPALSVEGILSLDPDVIIELVPDMEALGLARETVMEEWKEASAVKAVKYGRVYLVTEDYTQIPGPRFVLLLEDLAKILHP